MIYLKLLKLIILHLKDPNDLTVSVNYHISPLKMETQMQC